MTICTPITHGNSSIVQQPTSKEINPYYNNQKQQLNNPNTQTLNKGETWARDLLFLKLFVPFGLEHWGS
jgi:hypothetical protein